YEQRPSSAVNPYPNRFLFDVKPYSVHTSAGWNDYSCVSGSGLNEDYPGAAKRKRMQIWVDADACPAVIKDILYRAAQRWKIPMTLVANHMLMTPPSPYIKARQV